MEDAGVAEEGEHVRNILEGVGVGTLGAVELVLLGVRLGLGRVGVEGGVLNCEWLTHWSERG